MHLTLRCPEETWEADVTVTSMTCDGAGVEVWVEDVSWPDSFILREAGESWLQTPEAGPSRTNCLPSVFCDGVFFHIDRG